MPARNSTLRYGYVAQILHWVIVGLLIVQVTLGKIADDLPLGFEKLVILARHKSFGITILGLAVIRLAWRWISPPPPLPPMPRWQHAGRKPEPLGAVRDPVRHAAFRLDDVLGVEYPGELVRLRAVARSRRARSRRWKGRFHDLHHLLAWCLYALAGLHVAAAVKHQFIDRDGLLMRMLPGRPR